MLTTKSVSYSLIHKGPPQQMHLIWPIFYARCPSLHSLSGNLSVFLVTITELTVIDALGIYEPGSGFTKCLLKRSRLCNRRVFTFANTKHLEATIVI